MFLGVEDRVAIVIGGSRGIGRVVSRDLAHRGYAVVLDYAHDQCDAEAAVDEILGTGGTAVAVRADATDAVDVERLFAEAVEAFGGVDLVVHAAPGPRAIVDAQAARHLPESVTVVDAEARDQWAPGRDRVPEERRS
jgi:NAD(P)-dependent dehydrogenase (short-subunit alcohol dehydrogenase family)